MAILLNNFDTLCFDLKDMICAEVVRIKQIETSKKHYSSVLVELKDLDCDCCDDSFLNKISLNKIYECFNIGFEGELCEVDGSPVDITIEPDGRPLHWENIGTYSELYYKQLDYLFNCYIKTTVGEIQNIYQEYEIMYSYEVKPSKFIKYDYLNWSDAEANNPLFEEDDYEFKYYKKYEISEDIPEYELRDGSRPMIGNYDYRNLI
tara:strand:+ start:64 stop:681 length:618 start_codon:yes stop_codon:yes gene_type:complete